MSDVWEALGSFLVRPDSSGRRGGSNRVEPPARASDFPYDEPTDYGMPLAHMGGSGAGRSFHPPTPLDTRHGDFEEGLPEAQGTPMSLGRGTNSQSTNGRAGTNGAWASGRGSWNPRSVDDDELDHFSEGATVSRAQCRDILASLGIDPDIMDQGDDRDIFSGRMTLDFVPNESSWQLLRSMLATNS